jgi:hypothetical protein
MRTAISKKLTIAVVVLVWTLVGCQQKSVIDKCVEAQAIAICNGLVPISEKNPYCFMRLEVELRMSAFKAS